MFTLAYLASRPPDVSDVSHFKIEFLESGTATIYNQWTTPILVDGESVAKGGNKTLTVSNGTQVVIEESIPNSTFRAWRSVMSGVPHSLVEKVACKITEMPSMDKFTEDEAGTTAGNNFFACFNSYGSLQSLPEGSFNISKITTVGDGFFLSFNQGGSLQSLPANSFNTSNITTVGNEFFYYFNSTGALTSLPEGSFNTSNITTVGAEFFLRFNSDNGKLLLGEEGVDVGIKNVDSVPIIFDYWDGSSNVMYIQPGETAWYKKS